MATTQDNEGFEGIEVETPVGRFRAGRESGWNDDADYREARKRVRRNMAFYRHVWTYLTVLALLLVLDIASGWEGWWVHWVALIWGVILALHFLNVFVFDSLLGRDAERRMIERELRKRESRGH